MVMGKPTWANNIWGKRKHANGATDSSASWSWDSWEEPTWDSWSKGNGKNKTEKDKRQPFPQYQDMQVQVENKDTWHPLVEADDDGTEDVKQIQKYINAIRKAEARGRKLGELKSTREHQWKGFQDELQKSFLDQKRRYEADLAKLESDLQDAQKQKHEAASSLKQYVGGGKTSSAAPVVEAPDREDLAEWTALITEPSSAARAMDVDPWMQDMFQRTS